MGLFKKNKQDKYRKITNFPTAEPELPELEPEKPKFEGIEKDIFDSFLEDLVNLINYYKTKMKR